MNNSVLLISIIFFIFLLAISFIYARYKVNNEQNETNIKSNNPSIFSNRNIEKLDLKYDKHTYAIQALWYLFLHLLLMSIALFIAVYVFVAMLTTSKEEFIYAFESKAPLVLIFAGGGLVFRILMHRAIDKKEMLD